MRPLAILAMMVAVVPVAAHGFSGLVVFGDNMADAGRQFAATGGALPQSPPYFQGRWSNGLLWTERLAPKLGFAFNAADSFAAGVLVQGLTNQTQVSARLNYSPATLVAMWSGTNDYLGRVGVFPPAVLVPQVTGDIVNFLRGQISRGASTLLIANVFDLGRTPQGAASGQGALLTTLAKSHNDALAGALRGLEAASGARIITMDVAGLFNDIFAEPSRYGFTNTTSPRLNPTLAPTGACATTAATDATLFFDGFHPTAAGQDIIADFAAATLDQDANGARTLVAASALAPRAADFVHDAITSRDASVAEPDSPVGYAIVRRAWGRDDATTGRSGSSYRAALVVAGVEQRLADAWVVGGAAHVVHQTQRLDDGRGHNRHDAIGLSARLAYQGDTVRFSMFVLKAWDDVDQARATGFRPRSEATAHSHGSSTMIAVDAGIDLAASPSLMIGPIVGLRHVGARRGAITERGAAMFDLAVGQTTDDAVVADASLIAARMIQLGIYKFKPRLRLSYSHGIQRFPFRVETTDRVGTVRRNQGNVGARGRFELSAGLDAAVDTELTATIEFARTLSRPDGRDQAVTGRLTYRF